MSVFKSYDRAVAHAEAEAVAWESDMHIVAGANETFAVVDELDLTPEQDNAIVDTLFFEDTAD